MSVLVAGLLMVFALYLLLLAICFLIVILLPASFLGAPAKAVLNWMPPFLRGDELRNWASTIAEKSARERLEGKRTGDVAAQLVADVEKGAMRAMLPGADPSEIERVIACPESGQGMVGVTAPEALTIAAYLRKNRSLAEQERIYEQAVQNAKKIAGPAHSESGSPHLPCPLHGQAHVCCVYGVRPLRCRPLHAISIAKEMGGSSHISPESQSALADEKGHERTVAQGVEIGLTRALKSAGLDSRIYELNGALATAMETPDAAERWAKGENIFHDPQP